MGESNVNQGAVPRGVSIAKIDTREDFRFFDALPQELRHLLNHAPGMFEAKEVFELQRRVPAPQLYDAIVKFYQQKFPEWKPPPKGEIG